MYVEGEYAAGVDVQLPCNVKLVAQWAPITLKITKTVVNFPAGGAAATVGMDVTKDGSDWASGNNLSCSYSADGTYTVQTISPVTTGTYAITETNNGGPITVGDKTYYPTATVSDPVTVDGLKGEYVLNVTNTYSESKNVAYKLIKKWQDADGNAVAADSSTLPGSVSFSAKVGTADAVTYELTAADINTDKTAWEKYIILPANTDLSTITVTETVPTGYELVGGSVVKSDTNESYTKDDVTYECAAFTATNKLNTTNVTVTKTVTGNMGDWGKDFTFTYQIGNGAEQTFTLKHSVSCTITDVPIGSTVTITESGNDGYTVSATVDGQTATVTNNAITFTVGANGNAVVFTNNKDALIDTGIFTDTAPYIAFLSIAALGAFLMLSKRRYNGAY